MPMDWIENASPYLDIDKSSLRSISMASLAGNAGGFLGVSLGGILMGRSGSFLVEGKWWIRLLRIVVGLACIFLLYVGLQCIEPCESHPLMLIGWRFLGFYLISFSALYLLPLLFIRLKLMKAVR